MFVFFSAYKDVYFLELVDLIKHFKNKLASYKQDQTDICLTKNQTIRLHTLNVKKVIFTHRNKSRMVGC